MTKRHLATLPEFRPVLPAIFRAFVLFLTAFAFAGTVLTATNVTPAAAGSRNKNASYSDSQLIDGFMRTVFGAEDPAQRRMVNQGRVKKFPGRVNVHIINLADRDRSREVRHFLRRLSLSVKNLSIVPTSSRKRAQMMVFLVNRRDYQSVIRETLEGMPASARSSLMRRSACSAVTGGRKGARLDRAFVYIVADEGEANFRHCMVEEITQSLGPVNDDGHLTASIYNDRSRLNSFCVFDWYILNMLYDRRVRTGMTPAQVRKVLPAAIRDARKRLARNLATRRVAIAR